jgi:uncharacterized membrane protein
MERVDLMGATSYHLVARRNDSLSPKGRRMFFVSIFAVSLSVAVFWAVQGAWYILPFALVEMAVLFAALKIVEWHAGDYESVSIDGDQVVVERQDRGRTVRHRFDRHWAQVIVLHEGPGGRCGLRMRSHGREVSFGEFLTDQQRLQVAAELRRRLKNY